MLTLVLSGPASLRSNVITALRGTGATIEDSDHPHGWTPQPEESFITIHYHDLNAVASIVDAFGWTLRQHWAQTGEWKKVGDLQIDDPIAELRKLKAQLRAHGIKLED